MSLEDRLSVPDGPLRKNRRRSRILCPGKTTGCQLHASSTVEKRQSGSKKELSSCASCLYGFCGIFISPLPMDGIFPEALACRYSPPKHPHISCFRWTRREHNQASWFYFCIFFLQASSFQSFFLFFFFWKSLFAAKEKVWVFVINVVEIQICPPRKGVFINSHSPEN